MIKTLLNKFTLASVCSLLSLSVLTTSSYAETTNAYMGVSSGVIVNSSSTSGFTTYRGMPLNVFAGYGGCVTQWMYLAGELFGTATTLALSNGGNLKSTYGFGASALPGIPLNEYTLAFLRAGFVRSRFNTIGTTLTAAQFGLGLQTNITQGFDARVEYDYNAYNSISYNGKSTSPSGDNFLIGIIYKF